MGSFEFPIQYACIQTVGGAQSTQRKPTQNMHKQRPPPGLNPGRSCCWVKPLLHLTEAYKHTQTEMCHP